MKNIKLVSLNIGLPRAFIFKEKEVQSGINKRPVEKPIKLSVTGFEGDGSADLEHHGGESKAVSIYAYEHYPYWEERLEQRLKVGAFGENLTVLGMTEDEVCIGDIFQFGEALIQVTQPRQPCYKLGMRYHVEDLALQFQNSGYTGYYMRVLKEGRVTKESGLRLVERHFKGITLSFANQIMHHDKQNIEGIKQILEVEALSSSWRRTFSKRLQGEINDSTKRLAGE